MPRVNGTEAPRSWRELNGIVPLRRIADEELEVTVLYDSDIFSRFVGSVYRSINDVYAASHGLAEMRVTEDEFVRYSYTALRARVARVNQERVTVNSLRWQIRCDDAWSLPTTIAYVIARVGRVTLERPAVVTILPKWNSEHDDLVMGYEEWSSVSRRLRAVEVDSANKLVFAHAIEGSREGDERLMALIPVRDVNGRLVQIESVMTLDPTAAASYIILGMEPTIAESVALPRHPLMVPHQYIEAALVMQYLERLSDVSGL